MDSSNEFSYSLKNSAMLKLVGAILSRKENTILSKLAYFGSFCQQLFIDGLAKVLALLIIRALSMEPRTRQIEGIAPRAKSCGSRNPSTNFKKSLNPTEICKYHPKFANDIT